MVTSSTVESSQETITQVETSKGGLHKAIDEALKKDTETERIIAVLDLVRGYKNEFDINTEKLQTEGFVKCKNEHRSQISKIQYYISKNNFR